MMPIRSCLASTPSGFTDEQRIAHEVAYERELWLKHRVVVVRLRNAQGLPRLVTMALEAWAQTRFGKAA